jgi:FkbH-like protein
MEICLKAEGMVANVDHVLVNNISTLPEEPPKALEEYSFQIIQPPLRWVLHDGHYMRVNFMKLDEVQALHQHAINHLEAFIEQYLGYYRRTGLTTFITGFLVPQQNPLGKMLPRFELSNLQCFVDSLNRHMAAIAARHPNVHYMDLDDIASMIGKRHIMDDSLYATSHGSVVGDFDHELDQARLHPPRPYSEYQVLKGDEFLDAVWHSIRGQYRTLTQADPVKLVIMDLDDTMWRGVVAEDGIAAKGLEGWPIGIAEALIFLKQRGVLLAIASKNDESIIRKHWNEMFHGRLTLEDFASVKISWNQKTESIRQILEETNILPSNVLFIDDNPVERAMVEEAFPEIRALGQDLYYIRRVLLWAPELQVASVSEESARRTEMIHAQVVRENNRNTLNREQFIDSLKVQVEEVMISSQESRDFARAFELLNKTNQFNTTGKRWSHEEAVRFFSEGGFFHAFKVKDRFTSYGLVGVLVVLENQIKQFVMSCRVFGLDIEHRVLKSVINGIKGPIVFAEYVTTEKNHPCREIYQKSGFVFEDDLWCFKKEM